SKRHGATSVQEFVNEGYIKPAMFNFLVLLGWAFDDKTEQFTIDELVEKFDLKRISKSPAIFNKEKLDWFNGKYIREISNNNLAKELKLFFENTLDVDNYQKLSKFDFQDIANMVKERSKTLQDSLVMSEFLYKTPNFLSTNEITDMCDDNDQCKLVLEKSLELLNEINDFSINNLQKELKNLMEKLNLKPKQVLGTLRIVITNQKISPPIFDCLYILKKEESLRRISSALDSI
ncbi:MAG: glutamate--tRNA ligase family protein, partial [Dehalococcoidia bacterium]